MATTQRARLIAFFKDYAEATVTGNVEAVAQSYFSPYLEASPAGVESFVVDAAYRRKLEQRFAAMQKLGLRAASVELKTVRDISPEHWLVTVEWGLRFERADVEAILSRFEQSYLVRQDRSRFIVLCYVSHEDEAAVMERDGVL
jgi:hypothetical protein